MSYNARITSLQVHLGRLPESEVKVSFAQLCQTPSDPWTVAARLLCLWDSLLKLRFLISKTVSVMHQSEKYMPYWVTVKIKCTCALGTKYEDQSDDLRTLQSLRSTLQLGFPHSSVVRNPPANAGDARDAGLIPGSGRFPGEGNGNPFQNFCLGNPMDRGAWWARV